MTTNTKATSGANRRDFLVLTTTAMGAVGVASLIYPFISSMNPSPVFIRRREAKEIEEVRAVNVASLPDPESDAERTPYKPEWLIVVGICTHLGCVPLGQKPTDPHGEYGGWFCPCHGSQYDASGRVRVGPAPKNLEVPYYQFINDKTVRIGSEA
jgi:ubiquinol-cytochrome c reductase iron-sulfur subunit